MPRLTAELIAESPQFTNPVKEWELDLRGRDRAPWASCMCCLKATVIQSLFLIYLASLTDSFKPEIFDRYFTLSAVEVSCCSAHHPHPLTPPLPPVTCDVAEGSV